MWGISSHLNLDLTYWTNFWQKLCLTIRLCSRYSPFPSNPKTNKHSCFFITKARLASVNAHVQHIIGLDGVSLCFGVKTHTTCFLQMFLSMLCHSLVLSNFSNIDVISFFWSIIKDVNIYSGSNSKVIGWFFRQFWSSRLATREKLGRGVWPRCRRQGMISGLWCFGTFPLVNFVGRPRADFQRSMANDMSQFIDWEGEEGIPCCFRVLLPLAITLVQLVRDKIFHTVTLQIL